MVTRREVAAAVVVALGALELCSGVAAMAKATAVARPTPSSGHASNGKIIQRTITNVLHRLIVLCRQPG